MLDSEPTEDVCYLCQSIHAPLALHVVMVARGSFIDTLIYPVCERCYCAAIESTSPSAFRIIKDPIPAELASSVKVWTSRDYAQSWADAEKDDDDGDDEADTGEGHH